MSAFADRFTAAMSAKADDFVGCEFISLYASWNNSSRLKVEGA
jgi:hypothetical protein